MLHKLYNVDVVESSGYSLKGFFILKRINVNILRIRIHGVLTNGNKFCLSHQFTSNKSVGGSYYGISCT